MRLPPSVAVPAYSWRAGPSQAATTASVGVPEKGWPRALKASAFPMVETRRASRRAPSENPSAEWMMMLMVPAGVSATGPVIPAVTNRVMKSYWRMQVCRIPTAVRSPKKSRENPMPATRYSSERRGSSWGKSRSTVWLRRVVTLRRPPFTPVLAAWKSLRTKRVPPLKKYLIGDQRDLRRDEKEGSAPAARVRGSRPGDAGKSPVPAPEFRYRNQARNAAVFSFRTMLDESPPSRATPNRADRVGRSPALKGPPMTSGIRESLENQEQDSPGDGYDSICKDGSTPPYCHGPMVWRGICGPGSGQPSTHEDPP